MTAANDDYRQSLRARIWDWLRGFWVTYVEMTPYQRRTLVERINDPDAEYVEAPRPGASERQTCPAGDGLCETDDERYARLWRDPVLVSKQAGWLCWKCGEPVTGEVMPCG